MRGLLVVLLAGCTAVGAAPPPPPVPAVLHPLGRPLAIPGEGMLYEVTFRGLRVGRVQVGVGEPGWFEGRRAIIVESRGVTDGIVALLGELDWQLATTIDLERGRPLLTIEEAHLTFRGKTRTERSRSTRDVHSIHSAAAALRGWRSAPGQHARLAVRIDAAHLELALHEAGRDLLDQPAVRYEGVARGKYPFTIWISDDTARVPLRLRTSTRWGGIGVDLVEYTAPRD